MPLAWPSNSRIDCNPLESAAANNKKWFQAFKGKCRSMTKWFFAACLVTVALFSLTSCATNRDCHGVKHTTLSNGVRI